MKDKPITHSEPYKKAARFIAHYCGVKWIAPFGGNDHAAFEAICSSIVLWGRGDLKNRAAAVMMLRGGILAMQEHCRHTAYLAIIAILDWHIAGELVPMLVPDGDTTSVDNFLRALSLRGDERRPNLGRSQREERKMALPQLQLRFSPGGPMLDLSTREGTLALDGLEAEQLVDAGWSEDQAWRWLWALKDLSQSHLVAWQEKEARAAATRQTQPVELGAVQP